MDNMTAKLLIENLLDRIELESSSGKWKLGTISSKEKHALEIAAQAISEGGAAHVPEEPSGDSNIPEQEKADAHVDLNLRALGITSPENPNVTLCLDFGTAMSKAFAMEGNSSPIELALGKRAGVSGYPVDSSVFIAEDGLMFFGPQAVAKGADTGQVRFDSPKSRLSMGGQGEIDRMIVGKEINPTEFIFSEGELITLYLGYLTDLATSELKSSGYSRYTKRRFARPCWSDDRNRWAEPLLRRMLAQGQILADTFHDRWVGGISAGEVKSALNKIRKLPVAPDYLIDIGVPEPVAAAASLVLSDDAQRELFLVIDVGAGTTDFGVFLLQHNPDKDICLTRIIPGTIEYLPQAGNRVDDLLKSYILDAEGIDPATPEGRRHQAYLQSRIRLHKEELFRDGIVEVELANHHRVVVKKADFLSSERVKTFSSLLEQKLETVLAQVEDGYLGLMARGNLNVVLTGGGADLPMIQHMAKGVINVRGHIINREPSPRTPAWIVERYPQFEKQYPQLAVAIGGAMPDLPEMGASFSDFGGLPNLNYRP